MFVAGLTSLLVIIGSVAAAKDGGDDEWVHLPNKCEGKRQMSASISKTAHKVLKMSRNIKYVYKISEMSINISAVIQWLPPLHDTANVYI